MLTQGLKYHKLHKYWRLNFMKVLGDIRNIIRKFRQKMFVRQKLIKTYKKC